MIALANLQPSPPPIAQLTYRHRHYRRRARRAFDVMFAGMLLVAVSPLLALACICILIEDGRPVFFKQRRAGRFERLFSIFKLRTMRLDDCGDRPKPSDGG